VNAIELVALTRRFDEVLAVDHLDLVVAGGTIFGLLGPNGAGKSTTIKMLTTLLPPTSGSASVAGFDVAKDAAAVRRHIGYVPQLLSADGQLNEDLALGTQVTVRANAHVTKFLRRRPPTYFYRILSAKLRDNL